MKGFYRVARLGLILGCMGIISGAMAQAVGDYKTFAAGSWSNTASWSRWNGSTWVNPAPAAPTSADGVITIDHALTVSTVITIDQAVISASGSVELLAGGDITVANGPDAIDLDIFGTYKRTATATTLTPTGAVKFESGSIYIHNASGGTIPACTWDAASTLQIDVTVANNEFTESFGHVTFNGSSGCTMGTSTSAAFTRTIQGNLTLNTSGTVIVSNQAGFAATLTVNGNVQINSGTLIIDGGVTSSNNVSKKMIVKGNFQLNAGTFNFSNNASAAISANTRNAQLDVEGDFMHTGGTLTETASDADFFSRINMTKTSGSQNIESPGFSNASTNIIDFFVGNAGAKSVVAAGKTFLQAANTNFTVSAGASTPDLDINGTFINQGSNAWTTNGTWAVNINGTYVHNTLGGISGALNSATLNTGSYFIYRGSSTLNTPVSSSNRTYFNLAYESTSGTYAPTFSAGASPLTVNGTLRIGDGSANVTNLSQGAFSGTLNFNGDINVTLNSTLNCNSFTLAAGKVMTLANPNTASLSAFAAAQTFTFNGTVREANVNGFSGAANRAISNSNSPVISLGTAATVEFNGTSNQLSAGLPASVPNVTINNAGGVTLSANLDITGQLALMTGLFTLGSNNILLAGTLGGNAPSASNMVVADGSGEFRINFPGSGPFTFPVGDNTGTAEYSPITLDFTAGTYSSPWVGVKLTNAKHPSNSSTTDFLNRYWTVTQSGISSPVCTVTLQYASGDVNGTEANIYGGVRNGSGWECMDAVNPGSNTISKSITNFFDGIFTGGEMTVMNCSPCTDPTSGGTIDNAETSCVSFDPGTMSNTALPSGHTGNLEYKWQSSTTSALTGFSDIAASNSDSYDPGVITQTTWYRRLARVDCKSNWVGAAVSNVIEKTINCANPSSGGTLGNAQGNCGAFDPTAISSLSAAGGTSCTIEYKWQSSVTGSTSGFSDISGANASTYDPGIVSQTTWYKRLARANCKSDWTGAAESNVIEITINTAPSITGQPGSPAAVCAGTGSFSFSVTANGTGPLTYQWQEYAGSIWSDITNGGVYSGATSANLTITAPPVSINGNKYRCNVTGYCTPAATSDGAATVTVNDVPAKAVLPLPMDGAVNVSLTPDLTWSDGGGAASYDVYFGTASPGSFQGNQAATLYSPAGLVNSTVYYWRINPVNSCGTTTGDVWLFTSEPVTFNPGFENNVGTASGWTRDPSGNISTSIGTLPSNPVISVRSGNRRLNTVVSTTNERYVQHNGYPVVIPGTGTNYVHVIGYIRSADNADLGRVSAVSLDGGTTVSGALSATTSGSWVRFTASGTATNGKTYIPRVGFDGDFDAGGDPYAVDDVIIYTTPLSTGVDLTAPNAPSNLCINASGNSNSITWTDGTDNATQTSGINGVMILRAPAGTALPALNPQAYYSTDSKIGPSAVSGWTVLTNTVAPGTQSYTDANAGNVPYTYAVYMRDKAYNYSTPASFSTANGGPDQVLNCGATTATMAGTAPSPGYTGVWTLVSGTGTVSSPNSPTTTVTGVTANTVLLWTVTNGAGCTTNDNVAIHASVSADGHPVNDTVYNEIGTASFGVSPTFTAGVTYQWVVYNGSTWSNVVNGGVYSGATDSILYISDPPYSMNGYRYFCMISRSPCDAYQSGQASLAVLPLTVFSNTNSNACGTDFGSSFGTFTRTIAVSGLPAPLGTGYGQYVLQQIDIKLGSPSCKKDLSTYDFRLTAPDGTILDLITDLTSVSSNVWVDLHLRDQPALEKIRQYSTVMQSSYFPYSIGYYAVETDNSFQTVFNGRNPNGNWVLSIRENATAGNEISFQSVALHFGPVLPNKNVTTMDYNNECVNATCLDTKFRITATNNYYPQNDQNYPGNIVDGCDWNAANNNSTWFYFIATASNAYITISGNTNDTPGSDDTQPVVVTGNCGSGYSVPDGGCPNDESRNNKAYLSANGGGITTSGNVYVNGIGANTEFNLTGLTVGQKYYLVVDGNGGVSSTYYIEGLNGCAECYTLLPVELVEFSVNCSNDKTEIVWVTASEKDHLLFELQKSPDALTWTGVHSVSGSVNSNSLKYYAYQDPEVLFNNPYYRLKMTDAAGAVTYSRVVRSRCEAENKAPYWISSEENGFVIHSPYADDVRLYSIFDCLGSRLGSGKLQGGETVVNTSGLPKGIYFLQIGNTARNYKYVKN